MNKYEEALQTIGSIDLQDYPSVDSFLDSNEERYPTDIPLGLCYPEEMETLQEALNKSKAFDLIKEKKVDVLMILNFETYKDYIECYYDMLRNQYEVSDELNEEEWYFLKNMVEEEDE